MAREMLPYYDLWIRCANEALANEWPFCRIVWGR